MRAALFAIALAGCKISDATFTTGDTPGADGAAAVDAPPTSNADVTIRLYADITSVLGTTRNGQLVAVQDGDGPFVALTGTDGVYTSHVTSDRFAVVLGCAYTFRQSIEVIHQMIADGTTIDMPSCTSADGQANINGTLAGVQSGETAFIVTRQGASPAQTMTSFGTTTWMGANDLFAVRTLNGFPVQIARHANLDIENDIGGQAFDFAIEGMPLVSQPFTTNSTASGALSMVSNPRGMYLIEEQQTQGTGRHYDVLPASMMLADDLMSVSLNDPDGRGVTMLTRGTGSIALDVGTAVSVSTPTITPDPYLRVTFTIATATTTLPIVSYAGVATTSSQGQQRDWSASVSAAWVAATGASSFSLPDLTGLAGFSPTMELQTGTQVQMVTARIELSGVAPVDGRVVRTATQLDFVTP